MSLQHSKSVYICGKLYFVQICNFQSEQQLLSKPKCVFHSGIKHCAKMLNAQNDITTIENENTIPLNCLVLLQHITTKLREYLANVITSFKIVNMHS